MSCSSSTMSTRCFGMDAAHITGRTFRPGVGAVKSGLRMLDSACYSAARFPWGLPGRCKVGRLLTTLFASVAISLLALACPPSLAAQEWISYSSDPRNILEGNWQSCQQQDGRYAEKIYDHFVNSVPQYEIHLGPRREFAVFKGVQEEHREHESRENLLKPFRVLMEGSRARQRWEIPSLNLSFTVALGGGSTMDCESWYIVLAPLDKPSH
jgi:hypothetical protein